MQRHFPFHTLLILPVVVTFIGITRADGPATQPAANSFDASTPMSFMTGYDQLAGEGPEAYQVLYYMSDNPDDDLQRLAHAEAKFDAQVGILQKMVQQLWGNDAVDQTLHALGLKSMRDIQAATVKENGDRASVIFADGTPGPDLIKTPKGWRLNLPAFRKSLGIPVDDYLKQIHQLAKILPDVADGISNGKLKSSDAVVSDIVKRINAVVQ
jgi:hypothetical protein